MIDPEYAAVLDPFSHEAREIVQTAPPFDSFPEGIVKRAIERVKQKSGPRIIVDFDAKAVHADVLSFYFACQAVASISYPYSSEARLVTDATMATIRYRMYDLFKRGHEDLCLGAVQRSFKFKRLERENGAKLGSIELPKNDIFKLRDRSLAEDGIEIVDDRILAQYTPKYALRWTDFAPILRHQRVDLTKLYIVDGWVVITPRELWNFFANSIGARTEEYIASVYERFSDSGVPSKILEEVGEEIAKLAPKEAKIREEFAVLPRARLRPENFPPCVKKALSGVGSGVRNYAITVLLTSFLSYARVSPSGRAVTRIADFINDISTIENEVIPSIFEAAERCKPPFFRDQPQEKANVYYHLGFGMTAEPRLADSGKSKWYRTPNCRKIQTAAPPLCDPNELCKKIKNPLTYYYKKSAEQARVGG